MQLENLLIAVIVVSMVSVGMGSFYVEIAKTYGASPSENYQATFNRFNQSYLITSQITEDVKGGAVEGKEDTWDVGKTFKAGLNVVKVVFLNGIPSALGIMNNVVIFIPIPSHIIAGIQAIMICLLCFAIVYLYFRYKNPS